MIMEEPEQKTELPAPPEIIRVPTVETLPRRRGVVMRHDGISDCYGTRYTRDPRTRALRRLGQKVRPGKIIPAIAVIAAQ